MVLDCRSGWLLCAFDQQAASTFLLVALLVVQVLLSRVTGVWWVAAPVQHWPCPVRRRAAPAAVSCKTPSSGPAVQLAWLVLSMCIIMCCCSIRQEFLLRRSVWDYGKPPVEH